MTLLARLFAKRLLWVALAGLVMTSCSSASKGPGGTITKVKYYFLDPSQVLRTKDPAILFEREHYLHGAFTAAGQVARTGHYYTVMWSADDRNQPVTVRLEYRQANTALQVKKQEQQVADVLKHNETQFQVIGPEYQTGGRVTAWRVSILRGNEELASQDSYLWK